MAQVIDQQAQTLDLTIEQNADWNLALILKDEDGVVVDLTDYTAKMQIRRTNPSQVLIELTTENGRIEITPVDGLISMSISDTDLANIPTVDAEYDLLLTRLSTQRLIEGKVILIKGITK